jgi:hypothetical protein
MVPPSAISLRPDIPPALGAAIDRCVAKEPGDRFPNGEALVEALDAAQLAAPEVPLAIRLFAQEVATLGLIFSFLVLFAWLVMGSMSKVSALDVSLPILVLVAVGITRVFEVFYSARRLGAFGFSAEDVAKGFRAVAEEHQVHRIQLQADERTRRRRRSTVIRAALQILAAIALCVVGISGRVQTSPGHYRVTAFLATLFITGGCLFAVSIVLLVRSPFRMSIGERFFRALWLGPLGGKFLRLAIRP